VLCRKHVRDQSLGVERRVLLEGVKEQAICPEAVGQETREVSRLHAADHSSWAGRVEECGSCCRWLFRRPTHYLEEHGVPYRVLIDQGRTAKAYARRRSCQP